MSDNTEQQVRADRAAIELRNRGFDETTVQRFHEAAAAGDVEALRRIWFRRDLAPLPDARNANDVRPIFTAGEFPADPGKPGPGGEVITGAQLLARVADRDEIADRWGDEGLAATRYGRTGASKESIL